MNLTPTASSGDPFAAILAVPFGAFGIRTAGNVIHELVFLPPGTPAMPPDCALAERAAGQIHAWLEDPDHPFDLPLATRGTLFQQRVWDAIAAIPRGETRQYAHLSKALASAARAVGQACRANPFPLVIPCHRVVSAAGIGGFAGASGGYLIDAKRWLLAFEATR
ncbi:methylated-DNA--[protein]-cysteine S-methyltransferase [Azoarcus sp. PA01]|nr:methylated-DNA--[protein]-cysteine S-methyltransferase [Azoarcus sp. PA01]